MDPVRLLTILCILFLGLVSPASARPQQGLSVEERREAFVSGGRKISVRTFAPRGTGRFPAVLVLYSAAGKLAGNSELERLSRALAAQGRIAFIVDYFDRTRTVFAGGRTIDRYTTAWIATVRDAVNFAVVHPRVDPQAIGIFGYSLGAYLAVAISSTDRRIDAVVEIAGGIFEGFAEHMRRLPPTLILHGREDQRVPVSRAFELARIGRQLGSSPQIRIYEGEGHRLSRSVVTDAFSRTLAFFRTHLRVRANVRD